MQQTLHNTQEERLDHSLEQFHPVTLEEMNGVALLKRSETKYVMDKHALMDILSELPEDYDILEINNTRKNNYQTVYYDTDDFEMYHRHHNGFLNRYKVRTREYVDSRLCFIEIKFKNNKKKTVKKRIEIPPGTGVFEKDAADFVCEKSPFHCDALSPVLRNNYTRITLVSKKHVERLTIDLNLNFLNGKQDKEILFSNVVIAEIKQEGFSQQSDFVQLMHKKSVRPSGFSKYCIGVSSLYTDVKNNNFKERLLRVAKLNGGIAQ